MTKARTAGERRRAKAQRTLVRADAPLATLSREEARAHAAEAALGPTPERLAKGRFVVSDGRVYQDLASTPLRRALRRGVLTLAEVEAGERVEALWHALHGSQGRSCLDVSVRGSGETDPERHARLEEEMGRYRAAAGDAWGAMVDVAVMHGGLGDSRYRPFKRVKAALARVAEVREAAGALTVY